MCEVENAEVKLQRETNSFHSNNFAEAAEEEACEYAAHMAAFAQAQGMASSFLDVGCRTGYAMLTIQEKFPAARVVGVDIVPEFVDAASWRMDEVICASADDLPFPDKSFDWVLASHVLEHCVNLDKAISEVLRVAKAGVYFAVPLEPDLPEVRAMTPSHHHFIERPEEWLLKTNHPDFMLMWARRLPNKQSRFNFVYYRGRLQWKVASFELGGKTFLVPQEAYVLPTEESPK